MVQTTPTAPTALARRPDTAGPLAVATPTTHRLADASISLNTRRAYLGALARLDAWRGTRSGESRRRSTAKRDKAIIQAARQGRSLRDVGIQYGLSARAVHWILSRSVT